MSIRPRPASQGLVSIASAGTFAVALEVKAETEFVERNKQFQKFMNDITDLAIKNKIDSVEKLKAAQLDGKTVEATLTHLSAIIGENISLRRLQALSVDEGIVATYVHRAVSPNCGKIGVLVGLESSGDKEKLAILGRQLAMHIAAACPESLDVASLSKDLIARERSVYAHKAAKSGKPPEIIEKMIEDRLRRYYEQVVLFEQTFIIDGQTKISAVLQNAAKDLGGPVKVGGFVRYQLGA
jgi:elongation factor Ts